MLFRSLWTIFRNQDTVVIKVIEHLKQLIKNRENLRQCNLFVQLLSGKTVPSDYPNFQYECAQATPHLPILQWHDPNLDLQQVENATQQELLQATTVIVTDLVDFQEEIRQQLQQQKTLPSKREMDWVFISAAPEDKEFSKEIEKFLKARGIEYSLPLNISTNSSAEDIRQDLEENFLGCSAVVVPYYKTARTKVRHYLMLCRRLQTRRTQPVKAVAVCDKPFPNKPPLGMNLCQLKRLDCPTPQTKTCLPQFIRILNNG